MGQPVIPMPRTPGRRPRNNQPPAEYKIRTREHIIADLSVNHVERLILRQGHAVQRVEKDYGYDLQMFTFENGAFENGYVYMQLKATDELKVLQGGDSISFTLDRADINLWRRELMPVFLVVWDARQEAGYWLYMQAHLTRMRAHPLLPGQATLTVRLPKTNILDEASIERFRQYKNGIQRELEKVVDHHD